jgi:hypothetical protein
MQIGGRKRGEFEVVFFVFSTMGKTLQRRRLIGELVTMVELEKRIIIILYTVFSLSFSLSLLFIPGNI